MTKIQTPIIWTLTDYDANHILLAQKFRLEIIIRFVSKLFDACTEIDRSTDFTAPDLETGLSKAIMTVRIENLPCGLAIQLKRTPSRLLRAGNQLIVRPYGKMEWNPVSEKAKGIVLADKVLMEDVLLST
jgi:hypothetical protein